MNSRWHVAARYGPAGLVALLLLYGWLHGHWAGPGSPAWRPDPAPEGTVRVASWNLRNFPGEDHDLQHLRDEIDAVQPAILAVQEIVDPDALARLLPDYAVHISGRGGRGHQRLGVAFDPERFSLAAPLHEDTRLAPAGHVRPAVVASLQPRDGSAAWTVIVVHLKAKPEGWHKRRQQWAALATLVREHGDAPVIVLGDFNTTGAARHATEPGEAPAGERDRLRLVLEPTGLQSLPLVGQCTAYWQGVRHDAWLEPSWLDMIWTSKAFHSAVATAGGACARHACRPLRSTDAYPDPDLEGTSDHCPIWIDASLVELR